MNQVNVQESIPFDHARLDDLLEKAGIDVLLVTSKHNVCYMLGGYRFFFFDFMDAIGTSRYLPIVVYVRGRPDLTAYIANVLESHESVHGRFWMADVRTECWGVDDAVAKAIALIESAGPVNARIGVETCFLPADAWRALSGRFGVDRMVDALVPMERMRARKSKRELSLLREASDKVIDSMQTVIAGAEAGITTHELAHRLNVEEVKRHMSFEYCLVTAGRGYNRAPSAQRWEKGEIASLDSGGNYRGYIGDVCRMAVMGEPDQELQDLLGAIEEIQQAARKPVYPGSLGRSVIEAGTDLLMRSPYKSFTSYVAHGMGLISHEAPRLTSHGPVPYEGVDGDLPLEEGMVLSIETTMQHPTRGFIKLEDTVAVTADGWEGYGDRARGWNVAGG
jgi:Xaa-Pro aminopeptidase